MLFPNLEVKDDFAKFARENVKFLQEIRKDLVEEKSSTQIASEIQQPSRKSRSHYQEKTNPIYSKTACINHSVSSFGIRQ